MAQHRVPAQEAGVRYHGRTTNRGFKSNWEVSAAFVTSRANGYSGADMYWNCSLPVKSTKFGGKVVLNVVMKI